MGPPSDRGAIGIALAAALMALGAVLLLWRFDRRGVVVSAQAAALVALPTPAAPPPRLRLTLDELAAPPVARPVGHRVRRSVSISPAGCRDVLRDLPVPLDP